MKKTKVMMAMICQLALGTVFASGSNTYGVPTYLDQATYTINDYASPTSDLNRSHADGDRFSTQLKSRLNSVYPAIGVTRRYDIRDAAATHSAYVGGGQGSAEMVFFSGHGSQSGIYAQNNLTVTRWDKSYGGWTRWPFFSACLVLRNHDPEYYAPMFAGAHALFGYESLSWEYIHSYDCWWGCSYYRSEDVWNHFGDKWVNQGKFMYDAYVEAVQATIYNQGGHGVAPAAVYPYGNVSGTWFIGGTEKVTTMFNGDVSWSSLSHTHRYEVYGTPSY
jgi:hypothetical protein